MKNIDSFSHTRGESIYLDDIQVTQGTLYGVCYDAKIAHGIIKNLDLSEALKSKGVVRIFTAEDIPGENQIGGIIPDEPLMVDHHIHFSGMPIAFVVAESTELAHKAIKKIKIEVEELPVVVDPREAQKQGLLIVPPRTFSQGNTDEAWSKCAHIFENNVELNGQEHLYIETQGAYVCPTENGTLKVFSSTQGPTAVQRAISKVLGIPMHCIEVDVTRLGGGFGGKEDQANTWAALCALAAHILKKPVKYSLDRMEDLRMTGKRHPYSSDFKIGLGADFKIMAYEATFYQNAGAAADLSPAVLERTLFHCTNTYFVPNVKATAYSCKTNLPPNTAFRGFGGPQGVFVMECAITQAAEKLGIPAHVIQKANLIKDNEPFVYGQLAESEAEVCWNKAEETFESKKLILKVDDFNAKNTLFKKGISIMPICFGISFTKTLMNQARALVHVYSDGSVGISTGAVEMGQGVNTKIVQVAQSVFGIHPHRIKIFTTNTNRIANTSPSAASATADLNGKATQMACEAIKARLAGYASKQLNVDVSAIEFMDEKVLMNGTISELDWTSVVLGAFLDRIALSENAHYATPIIHFNPKIEKGHPFAYHVYGTAITEVTIDTTRGIYQVDSVKIVHDSGKSINPMIDKGQIEGALVQGMGWMTMEEISYDAKGKLKSNALSTYKVPDIYSAPSEIEVILNENDRNNLAIFRSKAVGEPPLLYGLGTYFAIRNAVKAFRPDVELVFDAPITPEKVLMALHG